MQTETVEQEIQRKGLINPRVTLEKIDKIIISEEYHWFEGSTVTICLLTLENGYNLVGESACADPRNFDAELGRRIAKDDAKQKIWALEGYLLRQRLYENAAVPANS